MNGGHSIIKRTKVEDDYKPVEDLFPYSDDKSMFTGEHLECLYLKRKRENVYEYLRCSKYEKIILLDSWDFNYCPLCGDKLEVKND